MEAGFMRKVSMFLVLAFLLAGCTFGKTPGADSPSADVPEPSVTDSNAPVGTPSTDGVEPVELATPSPVVPLDGGDYLENDFTLGIPKSTLYSYDFVAEGYTDVKASRYAGFYGARDAEGGAVLLTSDLKPVALTIGDYTVLEPFMFEGDVYFRVETRGTGWVDTPPRDEGILQLGGYAIVLSDGTQAVPFGVYDYIDKCVDGKLRAYSLTDESFYVISADGKVLKQFLDSDKIAPFQMYPDGYIYTRSNVNGHKHAVVSWDGEEVIPYGSHKDDIVAYYLGDGVFISSVLSENAGVYTADLKPSARTSGYKIRYALGKVPQVYAESEVGVKSEGKIVVSRNTNNLVEPLAKWEYSVTDLDGNVLVEPGKYRRIEDWRDGYSYAETDDGGVILDADCNEIELPDGIRITGLYADDAALFVAKVTKDFSLWRYATVPARYENPVGLLDGNLHWVIPPGEVDAFADLTMKSVELFGSCPTEGGNRTVRVQRKD
ncbi:hypothetical protein FACS1894208_02240 [Clostridia bacterium]|nr:hypothetical protein FACS1894208_02240 [Clostridia bacterium]